MATRVETGACATPNCHRQRVGNGVWCEVCEEDIPPNRQAVALSRRRRLARRMGVTEAALRAAVAEIPTDCCSNCSRPVHGGQEVCDRCWDEACRDAARRHARDAERGSGWAVALVLLVSGGLACSATYLLLLAVRAIGVIQ